MLIDYQLDQYTTRNTLLYTYFDEQSTHCTEKDKRRNAHFTSHICTGSAPDALIRRTRAESASLQLDYITRAKTHPT